MHADEIARKAAAAMWAGDKASPALGMEIVSVASGRATLAMTVRGDMVNGLDVCHGGLIFSLADSACAFASNSYNKAALLQSGQITLFAPAKVGTRLIAEASERHRAERSAIYDVTVHTEAGEVIAEFRGFTRTVPGTLFQS